MSKVTKVLDGASEIFGGISCVALVAMMLLTVVDVFLRKFFSSPILGSYEMTECILMITIFTGMVLAQKLKIHVKVTFFINFLPWRARCITHGILELGCAVSLYFLCRAAIIHAIFCYKGDWSTDVLDIPTFPLFWIMAVSLSVWGLCLIWDAILYFIASGNKEKADIVLDWYT